MSKLAFLLCFAIAFTWQACALDGSAMLNVRFQDGRVQRYATFPATTVHLLFSGGEAVAEPDTTPKTWKLPLPLLQKVQFVKLSDTQRRFAIAGVLYRDQLFTFDHLLCGENAGVMSQLMQATSASPSTSEEAIGLAKLYASLTDYHLADPAQFVVSNVDDLPKDAPSLPGESLQDIRYVMHEPRGLSVPAGYDVEFFTTDADWPRVCRWRMKFGPTGVTDATNQMIYPHYNETRELYSRAAANLAAGQEERIELMHCCIMANGLTEDGGPIDMQTWAASNGPSVDRTHYYYQSAGKATALMQHYMRDAIAIIEKEPWLDEEGKVAGKEAVVVLASTDKKNLYAAEIIEFEQDSSVLEISSGCLRNLRAIDVAAPKGKGATGSLLATLDCPDRVKSVAFSPDGKYLAAGYGWWSEGGVKVWSRGIQRVVHSWHSTTTADSTDMISHIAYSPDGKRLAAATWDGDVFLFDTSTWNEPSRLRLQAGTPTALSFSPTSDLFALSTNKGVVLYDLKSAKVTKLTTSQNVIQQFIEAGFLRDGKTLVVCDFQSLQFWDVATGKMTGRLTKPGADFFCNLSPNGTYVLTGGGAVYGKKLAQLWKIGDSTPPARMSAFRDGLFASAISPAEDLLAFAGGDYGDGGNLVLWKTGDSQELGHVTTGKFPIQGLAFSPDGALLAAASDDGSVFIYAVGLLRGPHGPIPEQ